MYSNNHYAPQALLKHWSPPNKQGLPDGIVWTFDFVKRELQRQHVRKVFARQHLFSPTDEIRFNSIIEEPLAKFRRAQLRRMQTNSQISSTPMLNGRTLRAVSLLWALQAARFSDALSRDKGTTDGNAARTLMALADIELDRIAGWFRGRFALGVVQIKPLPMYYPEFGAFFLPLLDPEKLREPSLAMVFPLDPYLALVALPPKWDLQHEHAAMIHAYSVGIGRSRSVIIPSQLMGARMDHDEVRELILDERRGAETIFAEIRAHAGRSGHDISGLPVGVSWPT